MNDVLKKIHELKIVPVVAIQECEVLPIVRTVWDTF